MIRHRVRRSLGAKLFAAQLLVIAAGSVTLALVALALAPGLFRGHVREALGIVPDDVARHLDEAFEDAVWVALAVAVAAAAVTAAAVSWVLSVRIVRPVRALADAAQRIARGAYGARVPAEGSDELAVLGGAFNDMASALETAERRRRELLSDLAHELRTPLATIEGYLEGLRDGVVEPGAASAVLLAETERLGRLVDDLAKVSRAEERQLDLRLAAVPVERLVAGAADAARPAYRAKGVALDTDAAGGLVPVRVDHDRMAEVLGNLLENALRHTPSGGRVEVTAHGRDGEVEIAVADSGEGIAPEHLPHVFERFYRADPARTRDGAGSGIGLTIARAIVEAHGGAIRAQSDGRGLGARFSVTLPRA